MLSCLAPLISVFGREKVSVNKLRQPWVRKVLSAPALGSADQLPLLPGPGDVLERRGTSFVVAG